MSKRKSLGEQVAAVRARIAALQAERAALMEQRRSRDECVAALESLIAHWSDRGAATFAHEAARMAHGDAGQLLTVKGNAAVVGGAGAAPFAVDLGPMFIALIGRDAVRAALLPAFERLPAGLPLPDRRIRIAEIDTDLDTAEREEEAVIAESEVLGEPIQRRADARPEIILAVE